MNKKDEKRVIKIITYAMMIPFLIIWILIKYIINNSKRIKENIVVNKAYRLKIYSGEKEMLEDMDKMNGIEFENFIASLLVANDFKHVITTKASGDHGADVLGEKDGVKYAFQCKRFESAVSSRPIGEVLRGLNYYKYDKGVVVTNNYFTNQAKEEASINNIELWNRKKIIELYRDTLREDQIDIIEHDKEMKFNWSENIPLIARIILEVGLVIAIAIGIWIFCRGTIKPTKDSEYDTKETISYYSIDEIIYKNAESVVDKEEFDIELEKSTSSSYNAQIYYIIKNNDHTYEEYNDLFKTEITKLYNEIRDKKIEWKTIWGKADCSNVNIELTLSYKLRENGVEQYFKGINLKYSDDSWKSSYEEVINSDIVTEKDFKKFKSALERNNK